MLYDFMIKASTYVTGTGTLPSVDWATDVEPQVQAFLSNGLVLGTLISVAAIAVAAIGARAVIGIFFTRH